MTDPFNQLPTDPEWVRQTMELGKRAAHELGCTVLLVAAQENGKLSISLDGMAETGNLAEAFKMGGLPGVLGSLALTIMAMEEHDKTRARS